MSVGKWEERVVASPESFVGWRSERVWVEGELAGEPGSAGTDSVNHPSHYGGEDDPYEAIKVIEAWGSNFNLGNALKYIRRADRKGGVQDLHKAAWYLQREIRRQETLGR